MSTRPEWQRVIGILGGLGPHAHVEFEMLLLDATVKAIGGSLADQDYPPWILSSMPATPDRTGALIHGTESPVDALAMSASRVAAAGADFCVIPCNTAHAFLGPLRAATELPVLDMIAATAEVAVARATRRGAIGVLAVTGTLQSGLYQDSIGRIAPHARVITLHDFPDGEALQDRLVMTPIFGERGIKAGAFREPERRRELKAPMEEAARRLARAGAELVLTACTEIPLVLGRDAVDETPLLDPMAAAADRAIEIALARRALPT